MVFIGQVNFASRIMEQNGVDTRYVFFSLRSPREKWNGCEEACGNAGHPPYRAVLPSLFAPILDALMTENRQAAGIGLVIVVEAFLESFRLTKGLPERENSECRWTSEMIGVLPASSNGFEDDAEVAWEGW